MNKRGPFAPQTQMPAPPVHKNPVRTAEVHKLNFGPPVYRPATVQMMAKPPVYRPQSIQRQIVPAAFHSPQVVVQKSGGGIATPPHIPRVNFSSTLIQRGASAFPNTRKGTGISNEPTVESTNVVGVYGISSRLTRGQALGTTGGAQTTYLDCTINGTFFGKFTNKLDDHFKSNVGITSKGPNEIQALKIARWTGYPAFAVKPDNWNSVNALEGAPHAEDLLIIALATAYGKSNIFFNAKGNLIQGKNPLLSIRINNSPCKRCAQNLVRACATYGLSLRIKASFHYEADDADSGTAILHGAGVPVRHWRSAQIANKSSGASGVKRRNSVTEVDFFKSARGNNTVQDGSWENNYKRANLDNKSTIKDYAESQLMM